MTMAANDLEQQIIRQAQLSTNAGDLEELAQACVQLNSRGAAQEVDEAVSRQSAEGSLNASELRALATAHRVLEDSQLLLPQHPAL